MTCGSSASNSRPQRDCIMPWHLGGEGRSALPKHGSLVPQSRDGLGACQDSKPSANSRGPATSPRLLVGNRLSPLRGSLEELLGAGRKGVLPKCPDDSDIQRPLVCSGRPWVGLHLGLSNAGRRSMNRATTNLSLVSITCGIAGPDPQALPLCAAGLVVRNRSERRTGHSCNECDMPGQSRRLELVDRGEPRVVPCASPNSLVTQETEP